MALAEAGEMAWWLRAVAALTEDPSSIPIQHPQDGSQSFVTPFSGNPTPSSSLCALHKNGTQTCIHAIHAYT